eukprot:228639-Rhodomonas_salina.1
MGSWSVLRRWCTKPNHSMSTFLSLSCCINPRISFLLCSDMRCRASLGAPQQPVSLIWDIYICISNMLWRGTGQSQYHSLLHPTRRPKP